MNLTCQVFQNCREVWALDCGNSTITCLASEGFDRGMGKVVSSTTPRTKLKRVGQTKY